MDGDEREQSAPEIWSSHIVVSLYICDAARHFYVYCLLQHGLLLFYASLITPSHAVVIIMMLLTFAEARASLSRHDGSSASIHAP